MIGPINDSTYKNPFAVETQKEKLLDRIGKKHEARVKTLPKGTFDPLLWKMLNQTGPCAYHWSVKEELLLGYLWVQEDISEFNALWSNEVGHIFRAYIAHFGDQDVTIDRYSSHVVNISLITEKVSKEKFVAIIEEYLKQEPSTKTKLERSEEARQFEKRMELLPLAFKISQTAYTRFGELMKQCPYGLNVSVVIGTRDENNEFDPKESKGISLIEISKYFLMGRLCYIHQKAGNPQFTTELAAPSLRSMEAFFQLEDLRKMVPEGQKDESLVFHLDPERDVSRKFPEFVTSRTLKDLKAYLLISQGGEFTCEPFKVVESIQKEEESLELSLDYQNSKWVLQTKIIEE